jgi:hypothetical protein
MDLPDFEEGKRIVDEMIASSPVVAHCQQDGCGAEITQAEINLGTAGRDTCSSCVLAYVADMCTF